MYSIVLSQTTPSSYSPSHKIMSLLFCSLTFSPSQPILHYLSFPLPPPNSSAPFLSTSTQNVFISNHFSPIIFFPDMFSHPIPSHPTHLFSPSHPPTPKPRPTHSFHTEMTSLKSCQVFSQCIVEINKKINKKYKPSIYFTCFFLTKLLSLRLYFDSVCIEEL